MSDFFNLMGVGFREEMAMIPVAVVRNQTQIIGRQTQISQGKNLEQVGYLSETDGQVEMLLSDALRLGLAGTIADDRKEFALPSGTVRIVGVLSDEADPCVTYIVKHSR